MKKLLSLIAIAVISLQGVELPKSIYKNNMHITTESNYKVYKLIDDAKKAIELNKGDEAKNLLIKSLKIASHTNGSKNISQYDYLFANYTLLALLNMDKESGEYKKLAKKIISFLDKTTHDGKDIWEDGDLGKFQIRVYRDISLNLANNYFKESNGEDKKLLKEALKYADISIKFSQDGEDAEAKELKTSIRSAQNEKK